MSAKTLFWLGASRSAVRSFPAGARRTAGYQLRRVQLGLNPDDWKPMATVGAGVREIRIHTEREHRVVYIAKFAEGIYVLHAFEKKARRTPKNELDLARERLGALVRMRRG